MVARSRWKSAVRNTFDLNARAYAERHRMQLQNLKHLASKLRAWCPSAKRILDIGAGSGSTIVELPEFGDIVGAEGEQRSLVRTDISRQALLERPVTVASVGVAVQCDVEQLPFADQTFDLVYANSVLHWVHLESGIDGFVRAVGEALRVTGDDGIFGASVAGAGTATRFLRAYRAVVAGPDVPDDPIGCMNLAEVVDGVQAAGGRVLDAVLVYEPVLYHSAEDYVADAAAYGYETFLESVSESARKATWDMIMVGFLDEAGAGPYLHDQYMIYVVARP